MSPKPLRNPPHSFLIPLFAPRLAVRGLTDRRTILGADAKYGLRPDIQESTSAITMRIRFVIAIERFKRQAAFGLESLFRTGREREGELPRQTA